MPIIHYYQSSFNAGEFSPRLMARTDFDKYISGLEVMENMIPLPEGGAMRRPGTRYAAEVKTSSLKTRLQKFEFSTTQAYIVEVGNQYFRFYRNQGRIDSANISASITNGTFDSGIASWTDQSTGTGGSIAHNSTNNTLELSSDATETAVAEQEVTNTQNDEHVLKFKVTTTPGLSVKLRIGTSSGATDILNDFDAMAGYHAIAFTPTTSNFFVQFRWITSAGTMTAEIDNVSLIDDSAVELETPYATADLFEIEGPQSADVLYLFHASYPPYKLERRGHTTWSLVRMLFEDGPYLPLNETATTLAATAVSGRTVLTASSTTGINGGAGFTTNDLYRLVRLDSATSGGNWGYAIIEDINSTTSVDVLVKRAFDTNTAKARWKLGSWSDETGWPSTATFFEERLLIANTSTQPTTLWGSQTSDYQNFTPDSANSSSKWDGTVENDDSLDFTLGANNVNAIRWILPAGDTLLVGTLGGEWRGTSAGAVMTPSDRTFQRQTIHGSAAVQPVGIENVVVFLQRAKRKLRMLQYSFDVDSFKAADLTRVAQHITFGGITEIEYAQEPNSILWAVRNDGQLLSMTFRREEEIVGWSRHILGGAFGSGDAVVESVAVIPGTNGAGQIQDSTNRNEVWVIVKRTINGDTKRYVEFFERDFETGHAQADAYYVDSMGTYDGTSTTSITGLGHLEGATVKILADGAVHADKTVASGAITLDTSSEVVQVGLGYTHKLKTLKFEGGNPRGTSVGKAKRIMKVTYVVLNGHILKVGRSSTELDSYDFRVVADAMDSPADYFTGEKALEFEGEYAGDARLVIEDSTPAPFTLLGLAYEVDLRSDSR